MKQLTWDDLFVNGDIVDVDISEWGARRQLRARDLGLEDSEDVQRALSFGCQRLATRERFEAINTVINRVNATTQKFSLNFPLIRGARFVPRARREELEKELSALKQDFDKAVDEFLGDYEQIKTEQLPVIERALREAAKNPDAAQRAYEVLVREYPSQDEIRGKFGLAWNIYAIRAPLGNDVAKFAERESSTISQALSSMVEELREEATSNLKNICELAVRGGKLNKKTIDSALEAIQRIKSLNFMGDSRLDDQIRAAEDLIGGIMDKRSDVKEDFIQGVNQIRAEIEKTNADAIRDAATKLSGMGKRKLSL